MLNGAFLDIVFLVILQLNVSSSICHEYETLKKNVKKWQMKSYFEISENKCIFALKLFSNDRMKYLLLQRKRRHHYKILKNWNEYTDPYQK